MKIDFSIWHDRTRSGEKCLQQDQLGVALIHYLAAIEQTRYWMESYSDLATAEEKITLLKLYLMACSNLIRFWYIQSIPAEQARYLTEALNLSQYLDPLSSKERAILEPIWQQLQLTAQRFINEYSDRPSTELASIEHGLAQLTSYITPMKHHSN